MTPGLDRPDPYGRPARAIVFAACLFLLAGIKGFARPDDLGVNAIARALEGSAQLAWLACYAAGGGLVIVGILGMVPFAHRPRRRPELEILGLWLLIGGGAINLLVVLTIRGPIPDGASLTTVGLLGLAVYMLHGRILDLYDLAQHEQPPDRPPWERREIPDRRTDYRADQ